MVLAAGMGSRYGGLKQIDPVGPGGEVRSLQVGDVVDANDPGGLTCVTVPGDGSARYVAIAQSVSSIGAAAHPFRFRGSCTRGGRSWRSRALESKCHYRWLGCGGRLVFPTTSTRTLR